MSLNPVTALKRLIQHLRDWRFKRRIRTFQFPIIKQHFPELFIKDLIDVQPMSTETTSLTGMFRFMDENNPVMGDIFRAGIRKKGTRKDCWCYMDDTVYWYKIWTRNGWVYQHNMSEKEWENLIKFYR